MSSTEQRFAAVLGLVTVSGFAALVYQVVWQRQLTLVLGNTVAASGIVLAAFLGGLALGAVAFGRVAERSSRPLALYGALELGVAVCALLTPAGFAGVGWCAVRLYAAFGPASALFSLGRLATCFVVLAPATLLMGGTLPALAAHLARPARGGEGRLSTVYAANTLGAATGALAAGLALVVWFGFARTLAVAAGLSLAVGVAALVLGRRIAPPAPDHAEPERGAVLAQPPGIAWLAAASFVSGALVLALEVVWTRALVLHLGSHVSAFSLMLATVLLGMGLGSLIVSRAVGRVEPLLLYGLLEAVGGLLAIVSLARLRQLGDFMSQLGAALGVHSYWGLVVVQGAAAAQVILLPAAVLGAAFPVVLEVASARAGGAARRVGSVLAANTLGTVVGALGTAFILVIWLGSGATLVAVAAVALALGLVLCLASSSSRRWVGVGGALLCAFLAAILARGPARPAGALLSAGIFADDHGRVVAASESAGGLVTVEERESPQGPYRSFSVNGVNVAGTSPDLVATQKLQGHLPLLIHGHARSVIHIGFGSGGTAWSVSRHPVATITVVEINPKVPEFAARFFFDQNHGVLTDPRLSLVWGDGRNILTLDERRYDAVLSDSIHPAYAGNGSLYTRDYYEIVRRRLNPDGVVSQWLPLSGVEPEVFRMILKSFAEVFPNVSVWYIHSVPNSYTITVGSLAAGSIDSARLARELARPEVAADLGEIGIHSAADLLSNFVAGREGVARLTVGAASHDDDRPLVEYLEARHNPTRTASFRAWSLAVNLRSLIAAREPVASYLDHADAGLLADLAARDAHVAQRLDLILGDVERTAGVK